MLESKKTSLKCAWIDARKYTTVDMFNNYCEFNKDDVAHFVHNCTEVYVQRVILKGF